MKLLSIVLDATVEKCNMADVQFWSATLERLTKLALGLKFAKFKSAINLIRDYSSDSCNSERTVLSLMPRPDDKTISLDRVCFFVMLVF